MSQPTRDELMMALQNIHTYYAAIIGLVTTHGDENDKRELLGAFDELESRAKKFLHHLTQQAKNK